MYKVLLFKFWRHLCKGSMDDLKLFGKTDKEVDSLVNTVKVFSSSIGMEFGIAKCGLLIGHFRVHVCLLFKTSLSGNFFFYEN